MNKYNKTFHTKVLQASAALEALNKKGCAIIALTINDNVPQITILAPRKGSLTADYSAVKGTVNGRLNIFHKRLHNCLVTWEQPAIN